MTDQSKNQDTSSFQARAMKIGDSVKYGKGFMILEDVRSIDSLPIDIFGADGKLYEARLRVYPDMSKLTEVNFSTPRLAIAKGNSLNVPDTLSSGTMIQLNKSDGKQIEIGVKVPSNLTQYLTLKALKFPFINLLWLGTVIMAIGFVISIVRRIQISRAGA